MQPWWYDKQLKKPKVLKKNNNSRLPSQQQIKNVSISTKTVFKWVIKLITLTDPSKWSPADVLSWIRWTARQFSCPEPVAENWEMSGANLLTLSDKDFASRAPQVSVLNVYWKEQRICADCTWWANNLMNLANAFLLAMSFTDLKKNVWHQGNRGGGWKKEEIYVYVKGESSLLCATHIPKRKHMEFNHLLLCLVPAHDVNSDHV